jgi:hypothetical protein
LNGRLLYDCEAMDESELTVTKHEQVRLLGFGDGFYHCRNAKGKYFKRKRASIAYMESTVVDISITPPSFKPVSLSLSRISSILKQPKQVFFNPINIFEHLLQVKLV